MKLKIKSKKKFKSKNDKNSKKTKIIEKRAKRPSIEKNKTLELGKSSKVKMEVSSNKTQKINTRMSVTGEHQRN